MNTLRTAVFLIEELKLVLQKNPNVGLNWTTSGTLETPGLGLQQVVDGSNQVLLLFVQVETWRLQVFFSVSFANFEAVPSPGNLRKKCRTSPTGPDRVQRSEIYVNGCSTCAYTKKYKQALNSHDHMMENVTYREANQNELRHRSTNDFVTSRFSDAFPAFINIFLMVKY